MEGYFWTAAITKDSQFRSCEADGLMLNIRLVKLARSIVGTYPRPEDQNHHLPSSFRNRHVRWMILYEHRGIWSFASRLMAFVSVNKESNKDDD